MTTRSLIPVIGTAIGGTMACLTLRGEEQLAAVVVFGFLTLCAFALLVRGRSSAERPLGLFLMAFGVRCLAAIALYEGGLVRVIGEPDAEVWSWAWAQSEVWRGHYTQAGTLPPSILGAFGGQNRGYIYLLAMMYSVLGIPSRLAAGFLNAFFGGMTVVLVFMIAHRLFDREVARIAGWLAAFFPSLIIWSSQTLKEPMVIFCECVILYAVIRLREVFSFRHLIYALLAVLIVSTMRFYVTYLALGIIGLGLAMPRLGVSNRSFVAGLILVAVAIPVLSSLGFLEGTRERFQTFDLRFVEYYRGVTSVGTGSGSAVQMDVDVKTPGGAFFGTILGLAHLMMAPFPWQLGRASVRMLLTLPELAVWWWLLVRCVVPGLVHALRTQFRVIQPLLLFLVPLSVLYGMLFSNIGLAFRQRAQLLPFYLIFAALGLVVLRRRRVERWVQQMAEHGEGSQRWRERPTRPASVPDVGRAAPAAASLGTVAGGPAVSSEAPG